MPSTAASIISRAMQKAKVGNVVNGAIQGYTVQALQELNSILEFIARTVDFSAAMRTFNFTFATNLVSSGGGNIVTAAPNPLPIDYLRVQTAGGVTGAQRSSTWYLNGVPYDMIEVDLTEWDDQVMQAGTQSYPYFWAKDMSQQFILANFTGDLSTASQTVSNVSDTTHLTAGMSVEGGIGGRWGTVPGTTITAVGANTITLNQAPAVTMAGASLMAGTPPVGLPYPPPSGAFNVSIRYQALPPPLTQAQVDAGAYCWFPEDLTLISLLGEALMGYSDDARAAQFGAYAAGTMAKYTKRADDRSNRAQQVMLDRRAFGGGYGSLPNTKLIGWTILLFFATSILLLGSGGGC